MHESLQRRIDLNDRVAIVTGAARGIGAEIACRLAQGGARVVLTDLDASAAESAAAQIQESTGVKTIGIASDVAQMGEGYRVVRHAVKSFGRLDILVNNAGVFVPRPVLEITEDNWDRTLTVDLKGLFFHSQAAGRYFANAGGGGRIINIASLNAVVPSGMLAPYDAAKSGVAGVTRSLAKELGQYRVTVNAVAPGAISTPGQAIALQGIVDLQGGAAVSTVGRRSMVGRDGEAADIADGVYFLASDLAAYITGILLVIDGGYLLY
ncbi:MAG: glucose 1-dehydrogenase [Steroidobacteraceae bacterium]